MPLLSLLSLDFISFHFHKTSVTIKTSPGSEDLSIATDAYKRQVVTNLDRLRVDHAAFFDYLRLGDPGLDKR